MFRASVNNQSRRADRSDRAGKTNVLVALGMGGADGRDFLHWRGAPDPAHERLPHVRRRGLVRGLPAAPCIQRRVWRGPHCGPAQ